MTELPPGWCKSTIGHLAAVDSGPAFQSKYFGGNDEGTRLLRGDNIEPGSLRWQRVRTWPEDRLPGFESLLVEPGDIILAMDRPVVSAGLKLARVRVRDAPALLVQRVARIRAREVNEDYLYYALQSREFLGHLQGNEVGTQLPHITLKSIRDFELPVPPLAEQRRIVEILEDHLSRIDAATATVRTVRKRLAALAELQLHRRFSLVPGEPTTLGEIAQWGSGGTPRAGSLRYYQNGTIPWVVSGELKDGPLASVEARITEAGLNESSAKWVPAGAVLVAMYGATIGRLALTDEPVTTNQAVAHALPREERVSAAYIFWFLRSQRRQLVAAGQGGAQPNISQTVLKAWPLRLPSLPSQQDAVEEAAYLHDQTRRLDSQIVTAEKRAAALRVALLGAAFSGRLGSGPSDFAHRMEI